MSDRITYHRPRAGLAAVGGTIDSARSRTTHIYEGMVVDVILDHMHEEYSLVDGYNVGAIKVRLNQVTQIIDDDLLDWAFPLDSSIMEYPLIGEKVQI
jgi:hypothetical protein